MRSLILVIVFAATGLLLCAQALEAFVRVADWRPTSPDGWLKIGRMRKRLGQVDGAMQAFGRILELRPGDSAPRVALR